MHPAKHGADAYILAEKTLCIITQMNRGHRFWQRPLQLPLSGKSSWVCMKASHY